MGAQVYLPVIVGLFVGIYARSWLIALSLPLVVALLSDLMFHTLYALATMGRLVTPRFPQTVPETLRMLQFAIYIGSVPGIIGYALGRLSSDAAPDKTGLAWLAWLLFSFRGRIPRHQYWTGILLGLFVLVGGLLLGRGLGAPVGPADGPLGYWVLVLFVPLLASASKRARDVGWPGIVAIGLYIPLLQFVLLLVLGLAPTYEPDGKSTA